MPLRHRERGFGKLASKATVTPLRSHRLGEDGGIPKWPIRTSLPCARPVWSHLIGGSMSMHFPPRAAPPAGSVHRPRIAVARMRWRLIWAKYVPLTGGSRMDISPCRCREDPSSGASGSAWVVE